jgi:DNA-binding transcriptional regulator YdaS (Cro superfamily)
MTTLLEYLKSLSPDERQAFAVRASTSVGYLNQVAHGYKRIGAEFALALEVASDDVLRAEELCPDFPWDTLCGRCGYYLACENKQ